MDEVAPIKISKLKLVPEAPWFDAEYAGLRKYTGMLRKSTEKVV